MTPLDALTLLNALIAGTEKLIPIVEAFASQGEIAADDQRKLKARIDSLRETTERHFSGPEWKV